MKLIKKLFSILIIVGLIVCSYFLVSGYFLYKTAVSNQPIESKITEIKSIDTYTDISNISQDFLDAIVSVEDKRFYSHNGIDIISTSRAVIKNIAALEYKEGGSSITQQLAKNMYFTREKKMARKVAEMFVAFQLEKNYSKDDILELYVNIIYYGDGFYGIKDACNGYFSVDPKDLSFDQATLLAGLPNAPSAYALSNHKDKALIRQKEVIKAMVNNNVITDEEASVILGY